MEFPTVEKLRPDISLIFLLLNAVIELPRFIFGMYDFLIFEDYLLKKLSKTVATLVYFL